MQIKIFGKSLFEFSGNRGHLVYQTGVDAMKDAKNLPDFYKFQHTQQYGGIAEYAIMEAPGQPGGAVAIPIKDKKPKKEAARIELTPKGVYELEMLNDKMFELKTDEEYVNTQIADFKEKLGIVQGATWDVGKGIQEISSIIMRLENRKQYKKFNSFFEDYPYTTTTKIDEVVKSNDHLKLGEVEQFVADMPKEAASAMKEYNEQTTNLCKKKAVFYIIANKKDFQRTSNRRDPILLAQSPFGHFWQILGAWDEEMILLESL